MTISQLADYTATPPLTDRVPLDARKKRPEKVACKVPHRAKLLNQHKGLERRQKPRADRREVVAIKDCRD